MPPKKKATGPVEVSASKTAAQKNVGIFICLNKLNTYLSCRLLNRRNQKVGDKQKLAQKPQRRNA